MLIHKKIENTIGMLSGIPNINYGGCGVAALAITRVAKRLNLEVEIVFAYCLDEINEYISNKKRSSGVTYVPLHIIAVVEGIPLDAGGEVDVSEFPFTHPVNQETLIALILCPYGWNPGFDRVTYLPLIEAHIGEPLIQKQ